MPEMDGFELTRQIRVREASNADSLRLPIIALTADAMPGTGAKCTAAGMDGYMTKPIDTALLLTKLAETLPTALALREPAAPEAAAPPTPETLDVPPEIEIDPEIIDINLLIELFDSFNEEAEALICEFTDELPENIDALATALATSDFEEARHLAHTMKGGAQSLGVARVGLIAGDIQDALDLSDPDTAKLKAALFPNALSELQETTRNFAKTAG
jgi:CheY-like chemotaxis protein